MSVAKTCLHQGKHNGLLVAVGASITVVFQAFLAVLLAQYIFSHPFVRNMLFRTGLVIFGILAVYFFIKAKKEQVKKVKVPDHQGLKSLGKGMAIALLNVLPIPFFCALSGTFKISSGDITDAPLETIVFILAAAAGTFTALYLYVIFFNKIDKKARSFTKYSNYFMAALMVVLIILTLIRMYYVSS